MEFATYMVTIILMAGSFGFGLLVSPEGHDTFKRIECKDNQIQILAEDKRLKRDWYYTEIPCGEE